VELIIRRLRGEKFKDIAEKMGRTNAACRSEYGRIRRGKHSVDVDLRDFDVLRGALPLGEKKVAGYMWVNLDGTYIKANPPEIAPEDLEGE
jgi:hypothetical protein